MSNPDTKPGGDWLKIVTEPDPQRFASAFTGNARLDLSVTSGPLIGPENLRRYFNASRGMFQRIAFTHETAAGSRTCLEWEGEFEGRDIAGTTILVRNADGAIESIQLYHRPFEQVIAFSTELAKRLEAPPR